MGKLAFLYAGQGSQKTGMGKDLYTDYPEFAEAFDSAELSFDLHEVCFENPGNILLQTEFTQPALAAFACGVSAILNNLGIEPDYVCGLSLGEYSALHYSGVWDTKTTIEIVASRGRYMADASTGIDCGMTAIMNMDAETINECCRKASKLGIVSICNYNCPGQIVIGGNKVAVDEAARLCKQVGAKRCLPLPVSGPFHTQYMAAAGEKLADLFKTIDFHQMQIPVLFNVLGEESEGQSVQELLISQVQSPVKMEKTITNLFAKGVDRFVEIGPGKTLSSFVKKTATGLSIDKYECYSLESTEDVELLKDKTDQLRG